jgi:hypothetical protein
VQKFATKTVASGIVLVLTLTALLSSFAAVVRAQYCPNTQTHPDSACENIVEPTNLWSCPAVTQTECATSKYQSPFQAAWMLSDYSSQNNRAYQTDQEIPCKRVYDCQWLGIDGCVRDMLPPYAEPTKIYWQGESCGS